MTSPSVFICIAELRFKPSTLQIISEQNFNVTTTEMIIESYYYQNVMNKLQFE